MRGMVSGLCNEIPLPARLLSFSSRMTGAEAMDQFEAVREKRRHKRLELEAEVIVRTDRAMIPGRSQEISEGGMSAILPVELGDGEKVELQVKLPSTIATTHAIVRDRNVFRHGFEFLQPLHGILGYSSGNCEACGGSGSIIRALDGETGVAFGYIKCTDCNGTGDLQ
jgi:PilZ domain